MKLTELNPEFIRFDDRVEDGQTKEYLCEVQGLAEAQAIFMDCPKCQRTHSIMIAFANRGVLDHQGTRSSDGRPTRWQVVSGAGFDDLTLSPSIDCTHSDPNCWHGFIKNGEVT
jgi:hypothetical protein